MIEFRYTAGQPDAERRSCYDCHFQQGAVSLWCVNTEAREARGTAIPNCHGCPFWQPMKPPTRWERFQHWLFPFMGPIFTDLTEKR